jgi:hypothetical protein
VINGDYKSQSLGAAKAAKDLDLRRMRSLSAFPVSSVLDKARSNPAGGPSCTGRMKD